MNTMSSYFENEDLRCNRLSIPQKKEDIKELNSNENKGKDKKWKK